MNVDEIKKNMKKTYDKNVDNLLSDENLCEDYIKQKSVIKNIDLYKNILYKNGLDKDKIKNIIKDLIKEVPSFIPAGVKGVVRGLKFNKIVEEYINKNIISKHNNLIFEIEKEHDKYKYDERPDMFIEHIGTKKVIIIMNQIDLWGGGAQTNRGNKYILNDELLDKYKDCLFLSVVEKYCEIGSKKTKKYILFSIGFAKKRLCYINGIYDIVKSFFEL
jgi:hypothetical protein